MPRNNLLDELIQELMEALTDGAITEDQLCHCGTYEEAYSTALKMVENMIENDCPTWAMQVCTAFGIILNYLTSAAQLEQPGGVVGQCAVEFIASRMLKVQAKGDINKRLCAVIRNVADISKQADTPDHGLGEILPNLESYLANGRVL